MAVEMTASQSERRDELVGRLFNSMLATMDTVSVFIGDRLGFYAALAEAGSSGDDGVTSTKLARETGTNERYAREWLEHQAATGILHVANPGDGPLERRFALAPEYHEVFLDRNSLNCMAGPIRLTVGALKPLEALLDAYRSGAGVPYADYGEHTREGIAEMNRPMFLNQLAGDWLPAMPDVHARLSAHPAAKIADVGCGTGWSTIAIARAYPAAEIHGYDVDEASIARAQANAAAAGLDGRIAFRMLDAASPELSGEYDLVTAFETIHDMAQPVAALANMRRMIKPGGVALVADERVEEQFAAPGTDVERLNYGFSVVHCLAVAIADAPDGVESAATGTCMRPPVFREYATRAGFSSVEILPVQHDFWWLYRLNP